MAYTSLQRSFSLAEGHISPHRMRLAIYLRNEPGNRSHSKSGLTHLLLPPAIVEIELMNL